MDMKIYYINSFGTIADGKTINTHAVQKAVDECSKNGGGIVRFDRSRYVLSTVFLKSNVTIEISEGTELLVRKAITITPKKNW